MTYQIRYNRSSNHIQGIPEKTLGAKNDNSATTGVVSYYASSACGSLTRGGHRMATLGVEYIDLNQVLDHARVNAEATGRKMCSNCEKAAERAISEMESETPVAETVFVCLGCGTNNRNDRCLSGDTYHPAGREMTREEYEQYKADRRPADKMSPTAQAVVNASAARDEAMRVAYEAEGTDCEAELDAAYEKADAAYNEAKQAHRAAREANGDFLTRTEREDQTLTEVDETGPCNERTTVDGIEYPCVKLGEHVEHNTKTGAAWWTSAHPEPAVAAAGRGSTQGKPYTSTGERWNGCDERIMHNGVGSSCDRSGDHRSHRTTTGIEWMTGQTRPLYCSHRRTSKGCDDCADYAALVDRILEAKTYSEAQALADMIERAKNVGD